MSRVSVMIPSCNEPFLPHTVRECVEKSTGDVEVIVCLDGWKPDPPLPNYPNLVLIEKPAAQGMRRGLNDMAKVATGKYIMKLDSHCMLEQGYDEKLQADCEWNWICVPRRYGVDSDTWTCRQGGKWHSVEYMYMTFPYYHKNMYGTGIHGVKWQTDPISMGYHSYYGPELAKKDIPIDDIIGSQGSCWFMERDYYMKLGMLDEVNSYNCFQDHTELTMKCWLSGGRMIVNKKVWYAHLHKGAKHGRGFKLSLESKRETERFHLDYWMNDRWPLAVMRMEDVLAKFLPMPTWPENWKEVKAQWEAEFPQAPFKVFNPNGHDGLKVPSLEELARKWHSDKLYGHSYIPTYEKLFNELKVGKMLEIGVGCSSSFRKDMREQLKGWKPGDCLRMWSEFRPFAKVYGCDVREEGFINEGNIRCFYGDQLDPSSLHAMMKEIGPVDLIIDDGCHKEGHQHAAALTLLPYVKPGGAYVIEDSKRPYRLGRSIGATEVIRFGPLGKDDSLVIVRK